MAKYVYPAVFEKERNGSYSIYFPNIQGCYSQGDDLAEGMYMAEDALALMMYHLEKEGAEIPKATDIREITVSKDCFVTYICCDTLDYQKRNNKKAVKKTLSIPEWLNEAANEANINYSQVLQDALKEKLRI